MGGDGRSDQLWVEAVGEIIVARVRGLPNEALLRELQVRVLRLVKETGKTCVMYDGLEMQAPPADLPLVQQRLDEELGGLHLRRAVLVPNTKLAYLARLAFGHGEYRVFYNDVMSAIKWLGEGSA